VIIIGLLDQLNAGLKDTKFESFKCTKVVLYDGKKKIELEDPITMKYLIKGVPVLQITPRNGELVWTNE
jgi:hypothetical protein